MERIKERVKDGVDLADMAVLFRSGRPLCLRSSLFTRHWHMREIKQLPTPMSCDVIMIRCFAGPGGKRYNKLQVLVMVPLIMYGRYGDLKNMNR